MKGLTNQPLTIWVAAAWYSHPEILTLMAAGHNVVNMGTALADVTSAPDLILHPAAHGWNDAMWDYLPAAIVAARARKKRKP